ncbi:hypothetical protein QV08_01330 [Gallibacterium salpingitidis]|uniref:Uncharacterized protein n=1 Tax=Gallibacterium salpingitidis TaxID=505341 RepID=A0AB36E2P3_9PAST|nr:hypothetical protein [Gallibacterium salpingitidis]OBX09605.1 hypothetical protein QV08_01330 [Gallibacterium salpingitidis]OBX10460.1 hypothetical protein QV09_05885 [Gallibacterium salpingitidis]
MGFSFSDVWNTVTGAFSTGDANGKGAGWIGGAVNWLENNKNTANLIGNTLMGVGGYFAQKEQAKDQMKALREQMDLERQLKSEYSAVPEVDTTYNSLTVGESPSLAGGGILTEMKKRTDERRNV